MEEIFTVFAIRELDFKDESGKEIKGTNFYMGQPCDDRGWLGMTCEKFFVSASRELSYFPDAGEVVVVVFNRYGKVTDIKRA